MEFDSKIAGVHHTFVIIRCEMRKTMLGKPKDVIANQFIRYIDGASC